MYLRGQKTATSECECERGPSKCEEVTIGEGGGPPNWGGERGSYKSGFWVEGRGGDEETPKATTYIHTYIRKYLYTVRATCGRRKREKRRTPMVPINPPVTLWHVQR